MSDLEDYQDGVIDILSRFDDNEILSLASTVTQGLLKKRINSREEAVKAIVNYSSNTISILKRKVFTREILLSYLHEKDITVKLPTTKQELISRIVDYWDNGKGTCRSEPIHSADVSDDSIPGIEVQRDSNTETLVQLPLNNQNSELARTSEGSNIYLLAQQFSEWFYTLLNENRLTAEHFYPDAALRLNLICNEESSTNSISNDREELTSCLLRTRLQNNLFFNPNLSTDGLKSYMDPHGLVIVMVSGTLHSNSVCVGVFEQMFALARDPFSENNWKIKNTELHLRNVQESTGVLAAGDSEMSCSSNELTRV